MKMANFLKKSKGLVLLLVVLMLLQCAALAANGADGTTVYVSISIDGELMIAADPVTLTGDLTVHEAMREAHIAYCPDGEAGFGAGIDPTYNMYLVNTVWGVAANPHIILNGAPLSVDENDASGLAETAAVVEGDHIVVAISTDYMNPSPAVSMASVVENGKATITAKSWALDFMTFTYASSPLAAYEVTDADGKVLGTTDADGKIVVDAAGKVIIEGLAARNYGAAAPAPVVTEPVVTEPVVTEPVVTEPVVTEPVVTEPVIAPAPAAADDAIYVSISIDGELMIAAEPVTLTGDKTVHEAMKAAHIAYCPDGEAGFGAGIDPTYNMYLVNTVWGVAANPHIILNGAPLSVEENDASGLAETAPVVPGDHIVVAISTDYMNPSPAVSMASVVENGKATITAKSWALDFMTFTYASSPLAAYEVTDADGKVLGTTDADGKIVVDAAGKVIIEGLAARNYGAAAPAPVVTEPVVTEPVVTAPVVMRSNQTITVDGAAAEFDVYNIDGNNYFKLRDIAMKLDGTGSSFGVGYDSTTRTITCTIGADYEPNGSELVIGEDLSATAVAGNQPLYINGELSTIKAYNLGGNNFFQLRELGAALGFEVGYDSATRTVLITTAPKASAGAYTMTVMGASADTPYAIPADDAFAAVEVKDNAFVSGTMGDNFGNGFTYFVAEDAFPAEHSHSTWTVITLGTKTAHGAVTVELVLDEGSETNKHAIISLTEGYAGTEEETAYISLRAKSGKPFYFYKVTITPAA